VGCILGLCLVCVSTHTADGTLSQCEAEGGDDCGMSDGMSPVVLVFLRWEWLQADRCTGPHILCVNFHSLAGMVEH
jgi:hypothetical protein